MTDDFSKTKIAKLSQPRVECVHQLAAAARTYTQEQPGTECDAILTATVPDQLSVDVQAAQKALELEQKKIISGLIRQRFVDTAINIPNKTTRSIVEWYLMIPSDTFLKYVEWHKENGFTF